MPTHERAIYRGTRRGRSLIVKVGTELRIGRLDASLSQRALGRMVGVSHSTIGRIERGQVRSLSILLVARIAAVLGLDVSIGLHPAGSPVRDVAHLRLLDRLRSQVPTGIRWRTEVLVPIAGDLRSADAVITGRGWTTLVEAETRLHDVQSLERRIGAKQRDLGIERVVLLVSDTAANRRTVAHVPELHRRFPVSARACLSALRAGRLPDGDSIVFL